MPESTEPPFIQEMGWRSTTFGHVFYIKIKTRDYRALSWREVWECFASSYPHQWAVQFFPPATKLVDDTNIYHLFVLGVPPGGVDISRGDNPIDSPNVMA